MALTPAVAGAESPAVFAGAVAPADLTGTDVPAIAEKEFSAVAVVDNIVTVPEPIKHSVDKKPSEVGSSPVDIVSVPEPIEHSDVRPLLHFPLVSGWSTRRILGIGRMVGRAIQMTVLPPVGVGSGGQESTQDVGEAIVVGAVGSAAPWFIGFFR